jgi:hypothetical protein
MKVKTTSGQQKLVISRAKWEAIGKKAGWSEYSRKIPLFRAEAVLKSEGQEEDPRPRLADIASDMLYDAETAIPSMVDSNPASRGRYAAEVVAAGEPRVVERTDSDEQGQYSEYDTFLDVVVTVYAVVPTEESIRESIERNWLELEK